ncbi:MAG TPA: type II toxin-antitoxin system VapC family toxin [Candidatus Competibacteraceae bacterium]|nr:type II toxin-antitoxin system VapC family toxin [Candidatus Competibacteraceae bacterium]
MQGRKSVIVTTGAASTATRAATVSPVQVMYAGLLIVAASYGWARYRYGLFLPESSGLVDFRQPGLPPWMPAPSPPTPALARSRARWPSAMLFDALQPSRLTAVATAAIEEGYAQGALACCDISLWEIAMLVARGRIDISNADVRQFIEDILLARNLQVLPINAEIAVMAHSPMLSHGDPADRLIAATALHHGARLVTSDERLCSVAALPILW